MNLTTKTYGTDVLLKFVILVSLVGLVTWVSTLALSVRAEAQGGYQYDATGNYRWTGAYQAPRINRPAPSYRPSRVRRPARVGVQRPVRRRTTRQAGPSKSPTARGRDCTPYNGPYGYYDNPWCKGGY